MSQNLLVTSPDRFSDGLLTVKIDHELTGKDRLSGRYSRAPHDETTTPVLPTLRADHSAAQSDRPAELDPHFQAARCSANSAASFTRSEFVQRSPNTRQGGVLRSVRHQQSAGRSAVRRRAQLDLHQHLADRIRRRRFQLPARHFERVQLCRQRHVDARQSRDEGRLHAHPLSAKYAGTGLRTEARHFNFRGDFTGQPFADFLLGIPFTASRVVGKGVETGRSWWHGYYVQDDWKITRKLTLNLGLRYEYVSPLRG